MSKDQTDAPGATDGGTLQQGPKAAPPRHRRRRLVPPLLRHMLQFCFSCVAVLVLLAALAAVGVGVTLNAPDWVRDRIAARLDATVPDHALQFGGMSLFIGPDLTPHVALRDVSVAGPDGTSLARLSSLEIAFAAPPLLRGEVQPATIHLSGARLVLRRRASGALSIVFDGDGRRAEDVQTVPQQIDALFARPQFAALREVTADALSLRYEDARAGRAWSADGGQLALVREGDDIRLSGNVVLLGARDYATTLEVNYSAEIGRPAASFGVKFEDVPSGDIAVQSPALAWLSALQAPISGALRAEVDAAGQLGPLNATLQIGAGAVQPTPATAPIRFRGARSYFTYDPVAQEISFSEFSIDSAWGRIRAEGVARLFGVAGGWPEELQAQIRIEEIVADPPGFYPEPVHLGGAEMALRLRLDPFVLTLGELTLSDQGRALAVRGEVRGLRDGWDIGLEGRMDAITPQRLLTLWPRTAKPKTREWLASNVRRAELSDIQLALRMRPGAPPDFHLGFDFADLETVYVRDVPPLRAASGHAVLHDNRFVIHAARGHVTAAQGGRMDVAGSSFIIPDVRIRQSPARADLQLRGPITAALSLLDAPPFRFIEKAGQTVDLAEGQVRLAGALFFLLKDRLTPEEVAFEVTGGLHDVRSEILVKGRVLGAERLAVEASNRHIEIGGKAQLGDVPVNGSWDMAIGGNIQGESRVRGRIEVSARFLDEFGITLPPGSLTGQGVAELAVDFARGAPGRFTLDSDLAGIGLRLPQLDWSLGEAQGGQLSVSGRLGAPPEVDEIRLSGNGLDALGRVTLAPNGGLDRAEFSRVRIRDWLDVPVALIGRGVGVAPAIEVTGGELDLRRIALGDAAGDTGSGGPLTLRLDRLQVSDGIALDEFRAVLDTAGGTTGRFSARLNGATPINGEIAPSGGRSAFRITSADAGGVLASAGLLQQAREGRLNLTLIPASEVGSYDGVLNIQQLRVTEAPALAALLNTISVIGLLEQFTGQGLHFRQVDARFRLTPDRLVLLEGSAVGASVGISMDGYYLMDSREMDMQGVVSPVYVLNAIGEAFTRPGEGLIGFNYTLRGPASNPRVDVNPLSALAPGFLREMFRRPAPQVEGAGGPTRVEPGQAETKVPPYERHDR